MSPPPSDLSDAYDEDSFANTINSLQMPRTSSDSDSDDDDASVLGLIPDRSAASSTISLDFEQRIEALQRLNTDLARKLTDVERTLQTKLAEHESELEEMESRLEEVRSELSATKREEKELRSKEVRLAYDRRCRSKVYRIFSVAHQPDADLSARVRDCETAEKPGDGACVLPESAEAVPGAVCRVGAVPEYAATTGRGDQGPQGGG